MSNPRSQIQILKLKTRLKSFAILVVVLSFGFCVLRLNNVFAQSKILINEFIIEPSPQQVEIINTGTDSADISGWIIDDSGGSTYYTIPQYSILNPNSCLVFSGDFNLNKSSTDTIRLINNQTLIDSFSYKSSSGSGVSYQRLPDGENNWGTGSANLGFFNSRNETCLFSTMIPTKTPVPTNSPTPTVGSDYLTPTDTLIPIETGRINPSPTEIQTPISYDNVFLSEAMVNPETGNSEWIEVYNNNDFTVTLTNWHIDDAENTGSTPRAFSLEIPAKNYKVFSLASSIFNNDGDSVRLLNFNKKLKDDFEYDNSTKGKTWRRIDFSNDNLCLQEPSYESTNNACINPIISPTSTTSPSKAPTPIFNTGLINQTPTILISSTGFTRKTSTLELTRFDVSDEGEILGITTQKNTNFLLTRLLSSISFSYSLLTIIAVLFKMKFIYEKDKKLFSSFVYSGGNQ